MFKKCKVVMLPSENVQVGTIMKRLVVEENDAINYDPNPKVGDLWINKNSLITTKTYKWEPQHLYILLDDEIKQGDWVLWIGTSSNEFQITKVDKIDFTFERQRDECGKIIATTDPSLGTHQGTDYYPLGFQSLPPLPDWFIKEYCELGGIDEVMVECYEDDFGEVCESNELGIDWGSGIDVSGKLKIAPDNTITIKKVKESFTREDMYKAYMAGRDHEYQTCQFVPNGKDKAQYAIVGESFNKWFEDLKIEG